VGAGLHGRLAGDAKAPAEITDTTTFCDKCQEMMEKAVLFIEIENEEKDQIVRTGRVWGIKEEAAKQLGVDPSTHRFAFIDRAMAEHLGFHAMAAGATASTELEVADEQEDEG